LTTSPIAVLTAEPDGRTMRVQLSDIRSVPAPSTLYLGGSSRAIVDDSGVVWQARVRVVGPTIAERLWIHVANFFNQRVIAFILIAIAAIALILASRAVIKAIFRSLRGTRKS
jgi:hypothetical protein